MAIESVTRVTGRANERRWTQWRREALDERHEGWPWEEVRAAVREAGRYEAKVCLVPQGPGERTSYLVAEREDSRSAFLDALVLLAGARGFRVAATEREEDYYVWVLLEPRDAPARLPGERPESAPLLTREDLQHRADAAHGDEP
jgi:hypothetical protein